MIWTLLSLTAVAAVRDTEKVLYCVPFKVVEWGREDLVRTTRECLDNNFVRNYGDAESWADAYMDALEARRCADKEDQNLKSVRREMVLTLRDTQLKVTHHIHAVEQCASLGNRMPRDLVDDSGGEMKLVVESSKAWLHHTRQDLNHCARVLHDVVARQQDHLRRQLAAGLAEFAEHLQRAERARESAQSALQRMLDRREELISAASSD